MALRGEFDPELTKLGWFDRQAETSEWFDGTCGPREPVLLASRSQLGLFAAEMSSAGWFDSSDIPARWYDPTVGPEDFPSQSVIPLSWFFAAPFFGSPWKCFVSSEKSGTRYLTGSAVPGDALYGRASANFVLAIDPNSVVGLSEVWMPDYAGHPWVSSSLVGLDGTVLVSAESLALTQYVRAPVTEPWPGSGTAGTSASRTWSNPGGLSPAHGGENLNGQETALFVNDGSNTFEVSDGVMSDMISASASSGWMIIKTAAQTLDSGNPQDNDPVIMDTGGYYGICLQPTVFGGTPSVAFFIVSGGVILFATQAITDNVWCLVQWRHTGTTVEIRVMAQGATVPSDWTVVTNIGADFVGDVDAGYAAQLLQMGTNFSGLVYGDFEMAAFGLIDRALSYDEMDGNAESQAQLWALNFGELEAGTVSAAINGHVGVDFDGLRQGLRQITTAAGSTTFRYCDTLISGTTYYYSLVATPRTFLADPGAGQDFNGAVLFGDLSANFGVAVHAGGFAAYQFDITTGWVRVGLIPAVANTTYFVEVWHDGTYLHLRVNNVEATPVAVPQTWLATYITAMIGILGSGDNGGRHGLDGTIHTFLTAQTDLDAPTRSGMGNFLGTYYSKAFGF